MDPKACFDTMTHANRQGDIQEAANYALDLLCWLAMGGFPPPGVYLPRVELVSHCKQLVYSATQMKEG